MLSSSAYHLTVLLAMMVESQIQALLTVGDDEEINSQDRESFTNPVVRILEFSLHHRSIYLNDNNAC